MSLGERALTRFVMADEEALETVANGGSMEVEKWAGMVASLLERLDYIVHNVFPMPRVPPAASFGPQYFPQQTSQSDASNSFPLASSNKENASPVDPQTSRATPPLSERVPDSQPQSSNDQANNTLPPPLAFLLATIRSSINSFFTEKPPHTVQRLAELILRPTAHYRTLPAYLRALDRVVSVTSSADVFPFQTQTSTAGQANGIHPGGAGGTYLPTDAFGGDDSLGGALLTPIPWLTNASFGSEDGSALEDATGEAITAQPPDAEIVGTTGAAENEDSAAAVVSSPPPDQSEEVPHARGPMVVGVEDMGLQDGKGVEMNLGEQGASADSQGADGANDSAASATEPQATGDSAAADKDGDIVLDDSKPKEGEESKTEGSSAESKREEKKTEAAETEKKD
ncbi:hypothetical protein N7474_006688 [Penicillium riverlandense]|uniref:uncharacterized protein n=1 Tax=Penicillium riverlandense TaxID=1903569 RepID=UPI002547CF1E|nr:uncharacterized protein N7474_006688 [Penicillium riverlandense]KAJ5814911.1 hypothetical protein N7474_006688 [Penicillium riverlandense]